MKPRYAMIITLCLSAISVADSTFTSSSMQYSIYLPENWVIDAAVDSQHHLYDTTGTCKAIIFISRSYINSVDYPTPEDWTRSHFVAYEYFVSHSYDPWGVVLYSDSSSDRVLDNTWSPVTYAEFVSTDSVLDSWREYVRFAAVGDYGYEISVWSDTTDMKDNIGLYSAIGSTIKFTGEISVIGSASRSRYQLKHILADENNNRVFDPLGRNVSSSGVQRRNAFGVYIDSKGKRVLRLRH
ncbi:MAG: hypothetical protein ACOC41_02500 [Chitinivibrionales bacterium]